MSVLYNTDILEKVPQSIRKNAIFRTFFRFFSILDIFKKCKKTSKWTEKNEHQRFFPCFSKNESICGQIFLFSKNARFFAIHFGPFCVCGAMLSRHFDFFKFREHTGNNSARFFWPPVHPLGVCSESILLFQIPRAYR